MRNIWVVIGVLLLATVGVFFLTKHRAAAPTGQQNTDVVNATNANLNVAVNTNNNQINANVSEAGNTNVAPAVEVTVPIANFFNRITKKPFGIYITPKTSPVQPERFTGYHAAADAEATGPDEKDIDVPVYSIADGTVLAVRYVSGYGGVVLIKYVIAKETVIGLFGHIRLSSVTLKVGNRVSKGQQIAVLGTGYSTETDGERKHLHFAVIKGSTITYRGYVQTKAELSAWYDPVVWLHQHGL